MRVLATTMPLVRPDSSRLDRVWFSPRWRTAAVLALLALAGVETASRYIVNVSAGGSGPCGRQHHSVGGNGRPRRRPHV